MEISRIKNLTGVTRYLAATLTAVGLFFIAVEFAIPKADGQSIKERYVLPADGMPNHNRQIDPFCCTGRTVVINGSDGSPMAYIYYADLIRGIILEAPSGPRDSAY